LNTELVTTPFPWLNGPLNAFAGFPFESVSALIAKLGLFQTLWKWTISTSGREYFVALQVHAFLPLFNSPHVPLYISKLSAFVDDCQLNGNCGFSAIKRRALMCLGLAGGVSCSAVHRKFWLQFAPESAILKLPGIKDIFQSATALADLVRERDTLAAVIQGLGLRVYEHHFQDWMKDESNFEMAFKLATLFYLAKAENFDSKILKALILFGEKKLTTESSVPIQKILGTLAAEISRRRDQSLDLSKLLKLCQVDTSCPRTLDVTSLDLPKGPKYKEELLRLQRGIKSHRRSSLLFRVSE
jgi:hypothetical protein